MRAAPRHPYAAADDQHTALLTFVSRATPPRQQLRDVIFVDSQR